MAAHATASQSFYKGDEIMDTITAYVENVFRTLPQTEEILRAKEEIRTNMLDKYSELKANGKSEHEALGIVISEFGNIDELLEEMNLLPSDRSLNQGAEKDSPADASKSLRFMSMAEVQECISSYRANAKLIALGVLLCILGVCSLLLIQQLALDNLFTSGVLVDGDDIIGLVGLFVFAAAGIVLFIVSGMRLSKYDYVTKGIQLDKETSAFLEAEKNRLQPSFTKNLIIGVIICVTSPIILFIASSLSSDESNYAVVPFLLVVGIGVYILVRSGVAFGCLTFLLTEYAKTPQERKANTVTGSICGVIMLIATAIFLYYGLVLDKWQYAPPIFAIGGVLCGVVALIINAIEVQKNK